MNALKAPFKRERKFEHQLAVTCVQLTCGNFEHAQISSQVEATCYKFARACDSFEWYKRKLPQVNLR
jgi:hypothetical protein